MRRRDVLAFVGSGAILLPVIVHGQRSTMPMVGFLGFTSAGAIAPRVAAFRNGLKESGFVEGESVTIDYRYAGGQFDRVPGLIEELVQAGATVIAVAPITDAARAASKKVPVVFTTGSDPVADGQVASLNRPGGNATGATFYSAILQAKQFELLRELVPTIKVVVVLTLPFASADEQFRQMRMGARFGEEIVRVNVSAVSELDAALSNIVQIRADAVIANSPAANQQIDRVVAFATQNRIPVISGIREFPAAGGLMSYGASINDTYHQVGIYTGRILKGAKPADLPIVQPTKFELVLNLKTARALGIAIPPTLLARADDVIE